MIRLLQLASASLLALSASACGTTSPDEAGSPAVDRDRLKVVSVFPLGAILFESTNAGGIPEGPGESMVAAIRAVLASRESTAGGFAVEYVPVDAKDPEEGLVTDEWCRTLGERLAADERVVAVVGPEHSFCATTLVPTLNREGLAVVSPTADDPCLTHALSSSPRFGGVECSPTEYYPSSLRTFARTTATVDAEGRAAARLFGSASARSVFVLSAVEGYETILAGFEEGARTVGLDVSFGKYGLERETRDLADELRWRERLFARITRELKESSADGVYLFAPERISIGAGNRTYPFAGPLLKAIRGSEFEGPIVGSLSTLSEALLTDAGAAAEGMLFTFPRVPPSGLGQEARRLVASIGVEDANADDAVYAAEAANVVLDAIAASDGTRAGVRAALFGLRREGLLGPLALDGNGDAVPQRIAVYQVEEGDFRYRRAVAVGALP